MAETVADVLIDTARSWGVDVIFGLPGDGINGVMESLRQRQDEVRFIQVRHEEAAAFMACAYAKYTGRLGACLATTGPGGIHLLNGIYDARFDRQPVLALTGLQYHDLIGTFSQQDVQLDRLFNEVAVYNNRVMGPSHVENVTNLACRAAMAYRGVGHVTIPADIQAMPAEGPRSPSNVPGHNAATFTTGSGLPREEDLMRAAEVLNRGSKVAILAGAGALGAGDVLEQVAGRLGAPIVKALLGKAVVPDDSPYTTGQVGLLGTAPSQDALEGCDTLLLVGTSFPYIEYLPQPGQAAAVQIDADPMRISLRYPADVGLVGDSGRTLDALLPLLQYKDDRQFLQQIQAGMQDWWSLMEERGTRQDSPLKPQVVAWELSKRLSDTAIVSADSGTITTWWARQMPVKRGQMHSVSGMMASMACGLPYAIAAQVAYPDRQCIAIVGDGGLSMLMAEFATCVKYGLPVKVIVFSNNSLAQIKWEQMVFLGNPEYGCELHPIDFASFARACGGTGFTVEEAAECGDALDQALNTPGPVILDARVDQLEAPMPPKIQMDQVMKLGQALIRGEPNRERLVLTAVSDRVRQMI